MNTELYGLLPNMERQLTLTPNDAQWEAELQFYQLGGDDNITARGSSPDTALQNLKRAYEIQKPSLACRFLDSFEHYEYEKKIEGLMELLGCEPEVALQWIEMSKNFPNRIET